MAELHFLSVFPAVPVPGGGRPVPGRAMLPVPPLSHRPPIRPLRLPGCSGVVPGHQKPGTGQEKAEKSHVCHGGVPQLLRLQPIVSIGPDVSISI